VAIINRCHLLVMDLISIEMMIRAGAMTLCLLLIILLVRDHRNAFPARLAIWLCLGVLCYLILETPGARPFNMADFFLFAGEVSIYAIFWLFARSWFNDEKRIGWRSWLLVAGSVGLSLISWTLHKLNQQVYWLTDIPMRVLWLVFVAAGLWTAWKGRRNDLVEARRRMRIGFICVVGGTLATATILFFVNNLVLDNIERYPVVIAVNSGIIAVMMLLITNMVKASPADLFAASQPPKEEREDISDSVTSALAARLQDYLGHERAYRDEALTIAQLASALNEREYRLRRVINGHLGYRNFPSFLNHYRLAEVKQALVDPDQHTVPILTIALDAGFGSLAPFNRAFRDAEGITPSEYRKKHIA
jgi:AraC-like DNA-binding protein